MIKKIKKFICKLFGIKQCECPDENEVGQKGLPIINETYTFQMIITGFVNKIIEINTTLVNHDLMKTVSA